MLEMLDPLGALVIAFMVMSLISIVGIALMFLVKNEKIKTGLFYFLAIWGMVVAYCNAQTVPPLQTGSLLLAWILGGLSVVALLIRLGMPRMEENKKSLITKILVTVSVVAGMIDCFII